ncbi:MAG: hypothetical protein A3E61_01755 [Candidatus Colwellbacteria bacterium RIFCSPHIGHO2_12_FULL_43_12]|uniref:Putative pterin-4-alpha-carbinolamine dehydratase n=1 Tax=Candidatus Colwellbacteria bacterium RIFCSPHIGHO2_12_FULL_43_12 TaxID=1797688 RepID=A0A1G1Z380_9BACT|nr:MAG: hypothetical protein A3E61_01755 [Candidatus Colwellbacteria bacterium RIFCSPHIGHO2_12_FULL_43_12]
MSLLEKRCVPCEGGTPPLSSIQIKGYLKEVPAWIVVEDKKISRGFKFNNFNQVMFFVNKVADLAEAEEHHPDIHIFYNKVSLELSTHAIRGLSENDFILAAKIDRL